MNNKLVKAALYARVSSPIPKNATPERIKEIQRQDTNNQLVPMTEFADKMLWQPIHYVDNQSAVKARPALQQLMKDAKERKIDVVLVWKLDRFARSMPDFVRLTSELASYKVRFLVLTQPIDTDEQTAAGKLLMNILATFAEFERSLTIERINASIARRKAQGLSIGREKVSVDMTELRKLRLEGKSIRQIARLMEVPRGTVENRLKELGEEVKIAKKKEELELVEFDYDDILAD